ncbi:MAG: cytochrome c [Methylophaga sp.]|nr:cytochrome c [Methylophaga sp.]
MVINQKLKTLLIAALLLSTLALQPAKADVQPYTVTNGNQLDAETFKGFQLFRNWCARCHGTYGQGLVGPNLADSLNKITYQQFLQTVAKGKNGQIGVMPAWENNKQVMDGRQQIYRYLKARADGAIGIEKPYIAQ